MGLELELELELELGLPATPPIDVGEAVRESFIKLVDNSLGHKLVHNLLMMAISVLQMVNCERNMNANHNRQTVYHQGEGRLLTLLQPRKVIKLGRRGRLGGGCLGGGA